MMIQEMAWLGLWVPNVEIHCFYSPSESGIEIKRIIFIESDIHGGVEFLHCWGITLVPFLVWRIIYKNAFEKRRSSFP